MYILLVYVLCNICLNFFQDFAYLNLKQYLHSRTNLLTWGRNMTDVLLRKLGMLLKK